MFQYVLPILDSLLFQVTVIISVVVFGICLYLDAINRDVSIGISNDMAAGARHGNAWVVEGNAVVQKRFNVDRPHLLEEPNRFQIKNIFDQLNALGFKSEYIEILVGDKVRVYRPDQTRPVLVAAR